MKNKRINRILAALLSGVMIAASCFTVYAESGKNTAETVYALLEADGSAREIIVKNNGVTEKNAKGELPFIIKISYALDNLEAKPQDMLGKSGNVKVIVDIKANAKAKEYYKQSMALQMQLPIDMSEGAARDINAPGLTSVVVGNTKTLGAIVLPGKSAKYEITYKTQAFEAQSVNFVCMPFDMAGSIDIDMSAVSGQVAELQKGISGYVDGVSQVGTGIAQTYDGMKKLAESGKQLAGGAQQSAAGVDALLEAMLATMPPQQQQAFAPQIEALKAGEKQINDSLSAYVAGVSKASDGLSGLSAGALELSKNGTTLKEGVNEAVAPLSEFTGANKKQAEAEAFTSDDTVSEIQFVMKTDALSAKTVKPDVVPLEKPKATFWSRLLDLFGL